MYYEFSKNDILLMQQLKVLVVSSSGITHYYPVLTPDKFWEKKGKLYKIGTYKNIQKLQETKITFIIILYQNSH